MQRFLRVCAVRRFARSYATKSVSAEPLANLTAQEKVCAARLMRTPWLARGQGRLCTRPAMLYAQKMFKTSPRKGVKCGGSALKLLHRYTKKYQALNAAQQRPYERLAKQNRRMRAADRSVVRAVRASPYALFMKKHYAAVAAKYAHITDAPKKLRAVSRAVAAKWKSTSRAQRQALSAQATQQRRGAARKLVVLVKKMNKRSKGSRKH